MLYTHQYYLIRDAQNKYPVSCGAKYVRLFNNSRYLKIKFTYIALINKFRLYSITAIDFGNYKIRNPNFVTLGQLLRPKKC